MIDLQILRILKYRADYYKVIGRVPERAMEAETMRLLRAFGKYFDKFPDKHVIQISGFASLFSMWNPNLTQEEKHSYANLLKRMKQDVPEEEKDSYLAELLNLRLGNDLSSVLVRFNEGEVDNLLGSVEEAVTNFKIDARIKGLDHVVVDPDQVLADASDGDGLRFRLRCLREHMRPLVAGDFLILAGRPDKGKTTAVASEITHMAELSKGTHGDFIWINNEGPSERIYPRLWQAALGCTVPELLSLKEQGVLMDRYAEVVGDPYRIKVFDAHGLDTYGIERILDKHDVAMTVFDMIDNVRGFGGAARQDLQLESMYQWGRELCVKYKMVGMATSQISADGADMQFPADHMLKDSKTGKQGACDAIIMIGAIDAPGYESTRFISTPKNKLQRTGMPRTPNATVIFDPERARYTDVEIEE